MALAGLHGLDSQRTNLAARTNFAANKDIIAKELAGLAGCRENVAGGDFGRMARPSVT